MSVGVSADRDRVEVGVGPAGGGVARDGRGRGRGVLRCLDDLGLYRLDVPLGVPRAELHGGPVDVEGTCVGRARERRVAAVSGVVRAGHARARVGGGERHAHHAGVRACARCCVAGDRRRGRRRVDRAVRGAKRAERRSSRSAARLACVRHPGEEVVEIAELDVTARGTARGVVGRVERGVTHAAHHDLDEAAASGGGVVDDGLQVGVRHGARRVGLRREPLPGRESLGDRGAHSACRPRVAVAAALDDALHGRVEGAAGVGEPDRVQPPRQDGRPVTADLGCRVRIVGQVRSAGGLAADVTSRGGDRLQLAPRHLVCSGAVPERTGLNEERRLGVVRRQRLLVAKRELADRPVVELEHDGDGAGRRRRGGSRPHDRDCDRKTKRSEDNRPRTDQPTRRLRPASQPLFSSPEIGQSCVAPTACLVERKANDLQMERRGHPICAQLFARDHQGRPRHDVSARWFWLRATG